ncbi:MAG: tRNA 2-thiouridine(34) synthase MnmA [Candidatus Brennerbacteria bacterium]
MAKQKVFVGMSGGVDSSIAALLLKKQGYDVTGVFMRCYNIDGCAERDAEDARRVAEHIGIPFYLFNFEEEYKKRVVTYMVEGYRAGLTPNPDVMCNREIKFGLFFKKAIALGADYVATGHYARVQRIAPLAQRDFLPARKSASLSPHRSSLRSDAKPAELRDVPRSNPVAPFFGLFEGKDKNKDQSYFLWTLTQKELSRTLFPVGNLLKPAVRAIAKKAGISTAEKKDSQGICFLGDVSLMDFLKNYLPSEKGNVFNLEGEKIGEHEGAHFYTIGQRHIGVAPHTKGGETARHYVALKDVATNAVVVAEGSDHPALYRKELTLTDVNFIRLPYDSPIRANWRIEVMARVRYRQSLSPAMLARDGKRFKLTFVAPQKFIAPGQSAVMYSAQGELLAGGVIV